MKQRRRIYYTETQKALMWDRWRKGDSLQQIAQLFDRNHSSVQGILAQSGGIRPAQRCRSRLALTLAEREEISLGLALGDSIRSIATLLGRVGQTRLPGIVHVAPRPVSLSRTDGWHAS